MARKTQNVYDLVSAVIATLNAPYGEDIIEDVCLSIESDAEWTARYAELRNTLGRDVVNNWIGQYTKIITELSTVRQVSATRSKIIGSYTKLV